ncbi:hypothetical protein AMS68_005783 [Peltaster fructicola]|uniref:Diphthamide biosynthesis protein 4 n=1 Tax=Peltaster fructicola TaxID=286661 RepID=A0A6H0Y002_9PEZI|nr:hypothetical protein AMS68_005783 [Peltaster fructicola]
MTTDVPRPKDFYEILNVTELRNGAATSTDRLRIAYKRALLAHHPDKTRTDATVTVDQISLAYKVLSDPALRQEYDAALRAGNDEQLRGKFRIFHTGLDTYDLDDLPFDDVTGHWRKACRCGDAGGFVVTQDELEANLPEGELITGCKGCSLWIKVLFDVDE